MSNQLLEYRLIQEMNIDLTENNDKFIGRCPICGDSSRKKSKRRFEIFVGKADGNYVCHCYNCGYNKSFGNFLKEEFPDLYEKYKLAQIRQKWWDDEPSASTIDLNQFKSNDFHLYVNKHGVSSFNESVFGGCVCVSSLPENHPARRYLFVTRKLPMKFLSSFFFTHDLSAFCEYLKSKVGDVVDFDFSKMGFPAVLIPVFDENGCVVYMQARNLMESDLRFITIKLNKTAKKIWNLHQVDLSKPVFALEGVFDAVFVENSIAMMGSSMAELTKFVPPNQLVMVLDNELDKPEINKIAQDFVNADLKVVIWPVSQQYKDVNDMFKSGVFNNSDDLMAYLNENVRQGLTALLLLKMRLKNVSVSNNFNRR